MKLNDYIERLEAVQSMAIDMHNETELNCSVWNCDTYWRFGLYDTDSDEMRFECDFETLDEMVEMMRVLLIGARLANGKEV